MGTAIGVADTPVRGALCLRHTRTKHVPWNVYTWGPAIALRRYARRAVLLHTHGNFFLWAIGLQPKLR